MAGTRKRYDWLFIISDNGLDKEFGRYCKMHSGISVNRAARGFVMKKKLVFDLPGYVKGNHEKISDFLLRHKGDWIED